MSLKFVIVDYRLVYFIDIDICPETHQQYILLAPNGKKNYFLNTFNCLQSFASKLVDFGDTNQYGWLAYPTPLFPIPTSTSEEFNKLGACVHQEQISRPNYINDETRAIL